jgi:hypothetical protein
VIFRSALAIQPSCGPVRPAFEAIAEVQQVARASDWCVTQPDHARISGELAAAFDPQQVPNLTPPVVRAIAMHDIGWMPYDGDVGTPCAPTALSSGVAISFANTEPERFLPAWLGSIQAAQSTGPLGGLLVSAHFARLTRPYLESGKGTSAQRDQVEQLRLRESARVERLMPMAGLPPQEIEALIAVLQFCDLASLYLCANPPAPVEFPQLLAGSRVQLSFQDGTYRMTPGLLARPFVCQIPCLRFVDGQPKREMVSVQLQ